MLINYLEKYGYLKKQIEKIIHNHSLNCYQEEKLLNKIIVINTFLEDLGFNNKQIIKMTSLQPELYCYNLKILQDKLENFLKIGYEFGTLLKMLEILPNLLAYHQEKINNKITELLNLGYTMKNIFNMTKKLPQLYCYKSNFITNYFQELLNLGYKKDQILKMSIKYPQIYSLNLENIKIKIVNLKTFLNLPLEIVLQITSISPQIFGAKLENIQSIVKVLNDFNYTKEEVSYLISVFSSILAFSKDTLIKHLDFYQQLNFQKEILNSPHKLIQSVELTKARINFLNENNFPFSFNDLYLNKDRFFQKYHITNTELLNKYLNYETETDLKISKKL